MSDKLVDFIDKRLHALAEAPMMWGRFESAEMQVLHLLEVKSMIMDPDRSEDDLSWIMDMYRSFIRRMFPKSADSTIYGSLMDLEKQEHLGEYLALYIDSINAILNYEVNSSVQESSDVARCTTDSRLPQGDVCKI